MRQWNRWFVTGLKELLVPSCLTPHETIPACTYGCATRQIHDHHNPNTLIYQSGDYGPTASCSCSITRIFLALVHNFTHPSHMWVFLHPPVRRGKMITGDSESKTMAVLRQDQCASEKVFSDQVWKKNIRAKMSITECSVWNVRLTDWHTRTLTAENWVWDKHVCHINCTATLTSSSWSQSKSFS